MTLDAATQSWLDAATEGPDFPGREGARKAFAEAGLPHRRVEDWKYTDLRNRIGEALPQAAPLPGPNDTKGPFAKLISYMLLQLRALFSFNPDQSQSFIHVQRGGTSE